jgi:hypothetical protein
MPLIPIPSQKYFGSVIYFHGDTDILTEKVSENTMFLYYSAFPNMNNLLNVRCFIPKEAETAAFLKVFKPRFDQIQHTTVTKKFGNIVNKME